MNPQTELVWLTANITDLLFILPLLLAISLFVLPIEQDLIGQGLIYLYKSLVSPLFGFFISLLLVVALVWIVLREPLSPAIVCGLIGLS